MKQGYVYLIVRNDDLPYIGITLKIERRIKDHLKSKRFSLIGIKYYRILYKGDYRECERLEPIYIEYYNSYRLGLNCTKTGKGKAETEKFNTLGYKYSDESRLKMSNNHWSKKGGIPWNKGVTGWLNITDELRQKRIKNSSREHTKNPNVMTLEEIKILIEDFEKFQITKELALKYCKKSQIELIESDKLNYAEIITKNGKLLCKKRVFSNEFCGVYNKTSNGIKGIIEEYYEKY